MRSIFTLLIGVALVAFVAAGCSSSNTASTPAKSSSSTTSNSSSDKPADASKPAEPAAAGPADQKDVAPLVDAAKARQDDSNSVTIKAVDQASGKVMALVFKPVYFDYDKYTIRPEDQSNVEYNANLLSKANGLKVVVEGHCDERGTTEYNLALGEHRAVAVMKAMTAAGVKQAQLKTVSYGKERPVDPGHTEEAWAKNRRSVVRNSSAS